MKKEKPKNIASSVRQQLLNLSKKRKEDFQLILTRYALERFLFRLGESPHKKTFILKGALLFLVWDENTYRPTRDADLLGKGDHSLAHLKNVFQEICALSVPDDGIIYLSNTVDVLRIKEDQEYPGARITFTARLTEAKIPIQIDVGFGDIISPASRQINFPTLLKFSSPSIRAYPPETVIAEKLQAMVQLGIANSRMKDFYDIWIMSKQFPFEGIILSQAIQKTFERRKTLLPSELPFALTPEFHDVPVKQSQWKAFIRKNKLIPEGEVEFSTAIAKIKQFLMPLLQCLAKGNEFTLNWKMDQGWRPRPRATHTQPSI